MKVLAHSNMFMFVYFGCYREDLNSKRIIERHIRDLKEYNELRDTGLRLVQIVSDDKKVSLKTIVEEIGYSIKDD